MVFSIPRTLDQINFGGWNSTENDEHLQIFRSDSQHWRIDATGFKLGYTPLTISSPRFLSLDPAYPYMYLPRDDFESVSERINTVSNVKVCSSETGSCFYEGKCE